MIVTLTAQSVDMTPLYESMCEQFGWTVDAALVTKMKSVKYKVV